MCPKTGKHHWQGFVQLKKTMRMSAVKTEIGDDAIHLEKRRGTPDEARDYCMKDERIDGPWEEGVFCTQGKRTDIDDVVDMIKNKKSWKEIIEECPSTFVKYSRGLEKVKFIYNESPPDREIVVTVLWGEPGVGKTRWVYENKPDVYRVQSSKWWDGYEGQNEILFDDFEGQIPYLNMLNYLDRYRLMLEFKGGQVWANWTKVYITSNEKPENWYIRDDMSKALLRRITSVTKLSVSK